MDPSLLDSLREQSGLRLDREGRFWHRGTLLEHERTVDALRRGLHRRGDGRWATRIGKEWGYLEVEDAARFVRRLVPDPIGLRAELLGGGEIRIHPRDLRADREGALFFLDPDDGERVRVLRSAQLSLAELLREDPASPSGLSLLLEGRLHPVAAGEPHASGQSAESSGSNGAPSAGPGDAARGSARPGK